MGCHETSVTNYQSSLPNIAEKRRSHWHGGGRVESRTINIINRRHCGR